MFNKILVHRPLQINLGRLFEKHGLYIPSTLKYNLHGYHKAHDSILFPMSDYVGFISQNQLSSTH